MHHTPSSTGKAWPHSQAFLMLGTLFCCCRLQNGKKATFALLDECQQLGAAAASNSNGSRLLVGLQEGVQQVTPLGAGAGVEVTTSNRR